MKTERPGRLYIKNGDEWVELNRTEDGPLVTFHIPPALTNREKIEFKSLISLISLIGVDSVTYRIQGPVVPDEEE